MDNPAVSCKSMAVGETVSEDMAWSLAWGVGAELGVVDAEAAGARAPGAGAQRHLLPLSQRRSQGEHAARQGGALHAHASHSQHRPSRPPFSPSRHRRIRWENMVGSEACYELDVWPELQSFTGDVISRTAFGSSYKEGRRIFQLQAEQAELLVQSIQNVYIPGYKFLPTPKNNRLKEADREIRGLLRGIIKKREQAIKLGKARNDDLLGLLMESNLEHFQEHGNKNAGMTTEDVIEECKLFYFARKETIAVLLTWTMIVLSMHPCWQVRARQEVLQVFGERRPDFDGLSRLKNVRCCFVLCYPA
ncbi:hypothetical protein BHE74_00023517 [Ensete ventricosum]|nr:hypothetical protein BHE74_00023517 [Ensete ventricosum]